MAGGNGASRIHRWVYVNVEGHVEVVVSKEGSGAFPLSDGKSEWVAVMRFICKWK